MCKAIMDMIQDGKKEGKAEGKIEGIDFVARNMIRDGDSDDKIQRSTLLSLEKIRLLRAQVASTAS